MTRLSGGRGAPAARPDWVGRRDEAAIFDGDVSLVIMLDLQTRVGMKPPGRLKVSPQIAGAIKAVVGMVDVQTL